MARLIVKSPYIKCGAGGRGAGGYLGYIGTRERVELLPDGRLPTQKQERLVRDLVRDYSDAKELGEYKDYAADRTRANASAFISAALENHWEDAQRSDVYMKYIATRPRAERLGSHGLFGDEDCVDLNTAMEELDHYTGNVWTHIISLQREDATRLGYDNAKAWRDLLRAHRNEIAAAMHIPPNDFRWYAALQKNEFAQYRLAKLYLTDKGAPKDADRAVELLEASAEQGNQYADYLLGKLCLDGTLVQQNVALGMAYMERAAQHGNAYAQLFVDRQESLKPPAVMLSVTRLFRSMGEAFRDNSLPQGGGMQTGLDRKRMQEMIEQKGYEAARSYAREYQAEQQYSGMSMATPW